MAVHQFDGVIVGAGGAGLMAALTASRSGAAGGGPAPRVAVLSKLYPTR